MIRGCGASGGEGGERPRRRGRRAAALRLVRDERGVGSLLVVAVIVLMFLASYVAIWAVGWLGSAQLARSLADSAAMAGANAKAHGRDACAEAKRVAASNDGAVVSCRVVGSEESFVVRVGVEVPLRPVIGVGPRVVRGDASAGSRP